MTSRPLHRRKLQYVVSDLFRSSNGTVALAPVALAPVALALVALAPVALAQVQVVTPVAALITEGQPLPGDTSLIPGSGTPTVVAISVSAQTSTSPSSPGAFVRSTNGPGTNAAGGFLVSVGTGAFSGTVGTVGEQRWNLWGRATKSAPLRVHRTASTNSPDGTFFSYGPTVGIGMTGVTSYTGRQTSTLTQAVPSALGRDGLTLVSSGGSSPAPSGISQFSQWGNAFSPRGASDGSTWFQADYATVGSTPNASGLFKTTDGNTITTVLASGSPVLSGSGALNVASVAGAASANFRLSPDGSRFIAPFATTGAATSALVSNGNVLSMAGTPVEVGATIPVAAGGTGSEVLTGSGGVISSVAAISDNGNWIAQLDTNNTSAPRVLLVNGNVVSRTSTAPLTVAINDAGDFAYILNTGGTNRLFLNGVPILSSGDLVNLAGGGTAGLTLVNLGSSNPMLWMSQRTVDKVDMLLMARTDGTGGPFSLFSFTAQVPEPATLCGLVGAGAVLLRRKR